ncbi:MAG TPA: phosphoadenosine phosphosulfate reductase family protein [Urbifossiella sp.]|nr:phosphoadenosine phosphosulfate reductase family protein [Urbifossiella sp.]
MSLLALTVRVRGSSRPSVCTTPEVDALVAGGAPVGIGVSGGKDSTAVAFAVNEHLDAVCHTGPRLLVHADLGVTEWADSLPACQRLADRLGLELLVVRRPQGDMMDRWEQRWRDNVARYVNLSCVKVILPWSTPAMRFCTAELKVDQITRALSRRYPGQAILNVTGIRREESTERKNAPTAKCEPKLDSKDRDTTGVTWNAIAHWSLDDALGIAADRGFAQHEGYTRFGSRRISCVYCILATESDHRISAGDERNLAVGRRMTDLEIASTFGFQGNRWLGDTLTEHLSPEQRDGITLAKDRAARRVRADSKIPKHLLYVKGWPTCVPTRDEAVLLGAVRFAVADAVGLTPTFINPDEIISRYEQLLALKAAKVAKKPRRKAA